MVLMKFDTIFDRVIGSEGNFTENASDSGNWTGGKVGCGKLNGTKFGISAAAYPDLDIKNITIDQARAIYYEDWYVKIGIGRFCDSMQYQMFDAAFNHGIHNASKIFQRAVGADDDGDIGPQTLNKASEMSENDKLLRFLGFRLKFYSSLKSFDDFGRGWSSRVAENLLYASEDN